MFEQAFNTIDAVLRRDAGCTSYLDYAEQTSWLLFLKYLDEIDAEKFAAAEIQGKEYTYVLDQPYRWRTWAAPMGNDEKIDHSKALTGADLQDFVNTALFPYLQQFIRRAVGPNTIEYKIGQIFCELKNKIRNGYNLREIIDCVDGLSINAQAETPDESSLSLLGCQRHILSVFLVRLATAEATTAHQPRG